MRANTQVHRTVIKGVGAKKHEVAFLAVLLVQDR